MYSIPCWRADPDALRVFAARDHVQGFSFTGPRDAFATLDQKQSAMGRALDQAGAAVEELVRMPFQRHTTVRASILVDVDLPGTAYGQHLQSIDIEATACSFGQFVPVAQVVQRSLLRA